MHPVYKQDVAKRLVISLSSRRRNRWCLDFVEEFDSFVNASLRALHPGLEYLSEDLVRSRHARMMKFLALRVIDLEDHPSKDDPDETLANLDVNGILEPRKPQVSLTAEDIDEIMRSYEMPPRLKPVETIKPLETRTSENLGQTLGKVMEVDYNPGITDEFLDSLFK